MNKLTSDFILDKYNLHVRLVNVDDAEYILSLRTNPKLSKFIHSTDNDVEKQKQWIRDYKERELLGTDYYFIYSYQGIPIGLSRIYDIHDNVGTSGSWLCSPENSAEQSVATLLIGRDILFEMLGLDIDSFDVRKKNTHVLKLHKSMGARIVDESEIDYFLRLDKEDYLSRRDDLLELLNLK